MKDTPRVKSNNAKPILTSEKSAHGGGPSSGEGKMEPSQNQMFPALAKPEDFEIHSCYEVLDEPFHGQATNSPEAERRMVRRKG